jgi:hypothetical protein
MPTRREFLAASAGLLIARPLLAEASRAAPSVITVYKDAGCGCCKKWVKHLSANGFVVNAQDVPSIDEIKQSLGLPTALQSCHTAVVDRYLIEGHVPASDIKKLLAARTAVRGLAVPGMPTGAPGMEGDRTDHYDVIAFTGDGKTRVFAHY